MKASECKCIVCEQPAVAFWPLIDPDIPAKPYCRSCLDKAKMQALINSFGLSKWCFFKTAIDLAEDDDIAQASQS